MWKCANCETDNDEDTLQCNSCDLHVPEMTDFEAHLQPDVSNPVYMIRWNFTNTTALRINHDIGEVPPKGSAVLEIREPEELVFYADNEITRKVFKRALLFPAPVIEKFTASTANIMLGEPVYLNWAIKYATRITLKDFGEFTGLDRTEICPDRSCTLSLIAENLSGNTRAELQLELPLPEILSFESDKKIVVAGEEITLTWNVANAARLTLTSDGVVVPLEGIRKQLTLSGDTLLMLKASNASGIMTRELAIKTVARPAIRFFRMNKPAFLFGDEVTLSWEAIDYSKLWLIMEDTRVEVTGVSMFAFPAAKSMDITLLCESKRKLLSVKATVSLKIVAAAKVDRLDIDRYFTVRSYPVTMSWSTSNASRVLLLPEGIALAAEGMITLVPEGNTIYTLMAGNEISEDTRSVQVDVLPLPLVSGVPVSFPPVRILYRTGAPEEDNTFTGSAGLWTRIKRLVDRGISLGAGLKVTSRYVVLERRKNLPGLQTNGAFRLLMQHIKAISKFNRIHLR